MAPNSIVENGARTDSNRHALRAGILNPCVYLFHHPGMCAIIEDKCAIGKRKREFALFSISSYQYLYKLTNLCHDLFIKLRSVVHLLYLSLRHSLLKT